MKLSKSRLGKADLAVSSFCLGANQFGTALAQAEVDALLDAFVEIGGSFVDTARIYGDYSSKVPTGPSERAIGIWIESRGRDKLVLGTKGGAPDLRNGLRTPRLLPYQLLQDLSESLNHLRTDYVDLYWLHYDDVSIPVKQIVDTLAEQQKAGKIKHLGASNWSPARIREAQAYSRSIGHEGFVAIQPSWGLAVPNREAASAQGYASWFEDGYRDLQSEEGFAVVPFGAQSRGYFTKLDRDGEAAMPKHLSAQYGNVENARLLPVVRELARKYEATVNQIGLAYLLCQPFLTIPIIGPRNREQLREAAGATQIKLSPADLGRLQPSA